LTERIIAEALDVWEWDHWRNDVEIEREMKEMHLITLLSNWRQNIKVFDAWLISLFIFQILLLFLSFAFPQHSL
jgi:hypothetical protein